VPYALTALRLTLMGPEIMSPCLGFVPHQSLTWRRQSQGATDLPSLYAAHTAQPPGALCFSQDKLGLSCCSAASGYQEKNYVLSL
jgi:hypothetical protein